MPDIFTIVPVKPFRRAKSRLSPVMSKPLRAATARAMLSHTLDTLASCDLHLATCVISRDVTALDIARRRGSIALAESESGLNAALNQAREWALSHGAQAILVLPADLPLLTPNDITSMLNLLREPRSVVIAPDAHGEGTNMLLVRPPDAIHFAFGQASFYEHCAQAETSLLALHIYRSPTVAFDLDTPADLKQLALDAHPLSEYDLSAWKGVFP
jgi:2-phospho-L-lactate/phosphoenolpyruvate guanylyltransferase